MAILREQKFTHLFYTPILDHLCNIFCNIDSWKLTVHISFLQYSLFFSETHLLRK